MMTLYEALERAKVNSPTDRSHFRITGYFHLHFSDVTRDTKSTAKLKICLFCVPSMALTQSASVFLKIFMMKFFHSNTLS